MSWESGLIIWPLAVSVLLFAAPRLLRVAGIATAVGIPLMALGLLHRLGSEGPWRHPLGGWGAPLGIDLHIDGLRALMLAMTALVGAVTTVYSFGYFGGREEERSGVKREIFWPLWFFLWGSLNALFLSGDAFNLYICLELVTLSGVALIALEGSAVALRAAMRYPLVSLFGSLCYFFGVALLYGEFGVVDLQQIAQATSSGGGASWVALAMISAGLLLKTALFPVHFWLPPAHASAPAPVSAVLSGLVVKASFYLLMRFWFEIFEPGAPATLFLGILGGLAILWGSLQALRQERLKLLVAYSTVAQIGYLFLLFPLAQSGGFSAWSATILFALTHACAKGAIFMAAGTILHSVGHDRIAEFGSLGRSMHLTLITLGLSGIALIGLPPSGSFMAKWVLLSVAFAGGEWWWVVVILGGTLLSAAYVFRVLSPLFRPQEETPLSRPPGALLQWSAFALALFALALGFFAEIPVRMAAIGAPFDHPILQVWP
jgi:multicomponent Na+:H+ antiporter subunit D